MDVHDGFHNTNSITSMIQWCEKYKLIIISLNSNRTLTDISKVVNHIN